MNFFYFIYLFSLGGGGVCISSSLRCLPPSDFQSLCIVNVPFLSSMLFLVCVSVAHFLFYFDSQCIEFCVLVSRHVRFVPAVFSPVPHPLFFLLVYLSPASSVFIAGLSISHPASPPLGAHVSGPSFPALCSAFLPVFHVHSKFNQFSIS